MLGKVDDLLDPSADLGRKDQAVGEVQSFSEELLELLLAFSSCRRLPAIAMLRHC